MNTILTFLINSVHIFNNRRFKVGLNNRNSIFLIQTPFLLFSNFPSYLSIFILIIYVRNKNVRRSEKKEIFNRIEN